MAMGLVMVVVRWRWSLLFDCYFSHCPDNCLKIQLMLIIMIENSVHVAVVVPFVVVAICFPKVIVGGGAVAVAAADVAFVKISTEPWVIGFVTVTVHHHSHPFHVRLVDFVYHCCYQIGQYVVGPSVVRFGGKQNVPFVYDSVVVQ